MLQPVHLFPFVQFLIDSQSVSCFKFLESNKIGAEKKEGN